MGFITKILKTGLLAGAAYAAVKVSEKYKGNNPNGFSSEEEKKEAIKQAATEVFHEAKQLYNEKAPGVQQTVNTAAQKAVNLAKTYAPEAVSVVQETVQTVADKAQQFADNLSTETYDAEFTVVDDDTPRAPANDNSQANAGQAPLDPVDVKKE